MTQRPRPSHPISAQAPVRDVMHRNVVVVDGTDQILDVARVMETRDIGDVLVRGDGGAIGILTDRDIVTRVVADGREFAATTADEIASHRVATIDAGETIAAAVSLMRDRAVRRLPVMEAGEPVGVVTLGDLAVEREPGSVLADVTAAPPNL